MDSRPAWGTLLPSILEQSAKMRYDELKTYTYNANGLLSSVTNKDGTTDLTWDILMGDGVVISASINGEETNYTYGLERISAQTGNRKTEYVYDGRGSVAAEVSYNNAWYTFGGAFSKKDVTTKSYTPFGEQIGEQVSGFGYNGEYYNAATGMVYLRARFYEPEMNRFSQKDIVRGSITAPNSLNRYTYVQNDPVNFIDPSGEKLMSTLSNAWNSVKNFFTGGSSKPAPAAPSKPAASSTGSKTSATSANTAGTAAKKSTTSSATAYAGSSSGTNRVQSPGPVQSTAQNVNPYNVAQSTAQAVADARKAADYMNATAPGSPAAQQATRAYMETQRLASMANATHDPNIARQAVQASQASVNHTNNVATGRSPNTYSPYNSNGNATSYFNSSYQSGKAPSPDAPRIEDVTADSVYYCSIAKRVPNTNALGAGDYEGISRAANALVAAGKVAGTAIVDYYNSIEKVETSNVKYYKITIDSKADIVVHSLIQAGKIAIDFVEIYLLYTGAAAAFAATPASAGGSAVLAAAFLEGATLAGISLVSDVNSTIKDISEYRNTGEVTIEITPHSYNVEDILLWSIS